MGNRLKAGDPFLYNESNHMVGIRNPDGTETSFLPLATEAISGTKNGVNTAFTISNASATFVAVYLNGVRLKAGVGYTRSGASITAAAGYIPQAGDTYEADLA